MDNVERRMLMDVMVNLDTSAIAFAMFRHVPYATDLHVCEFVHRNDNDEIPFSDWE